MPAATAAAASNGLGLFCRFPTMTLPAAVGCLPRGGGFQHPTSSPPSPQFGYQSSPYSPRNFSPHPSLSLTLLVAGYMDNVRRLDDRPTAEKPYERNQLCSPSTTTTIIHNDDKHVYYYYINDVVNCIPHSERLLPGGTNRGEPRHVVGMFLDTYFWMERGWRERQGGSVATVILMKSIPGSTRQ
jgi:hypothetical protein